MSETIKPVETVAPVAGTEPVVETKPVDATTQEVDLLDEFQKVLADNAKLVAERDNYKKGLLNAKKGIVEPTEPTLDEEEVERRAEARAQELLAQKAQEANAQKAQEIALKALKENRELKTALRNSKGIATAPSGMGSADQNAPKTGIWTAEQLAYFKKRGIDPQKVAENYLRMKS